VTKAADPESESTTTTTSSSSNGHGAGGGVLGCIDIRLPQSVTGTAAIGVPEGDAAGCYLLNVVVEEESRGQGLGKALMKVAVQRAVEQWGAERLYTHVEATNEVAYRLYCSCGFKEHSQESRFQNTMQLGRLILLMATAADVAEVLARVTSPQADSAPLETDASGPSLEGTSGNNRPTTVQAAAAAAT